MNKPNNNIEECFVIMPISEVEGYEENHFKTVYEHLIKPAIIKAGYKPVRADDVKVTNSIRLDIIRRLLEAPMAICDLSTINANVFYELGIRQTINKPVVLIQEEGTPRVFDISDIRTIDYNKKMRPDKLSKNIDSIYDGVIATKEAINDPMHVNSLVALLKEGGSILPNKVQEIDFPRTGLYGNNILYSEFVKGEPDTYSMSVIIPNGEKISVEIKGENWFYPIMQPNLKWDSDDWNESEKSRLFTSVDIGIIDFKLKITDETMLSIKVFNNDNVIQSKLIEIKKSPFEVDDNGNMLANNFITKG